MEVIGYIVTCAKLPNIFPCIKVVNSFKVIENVNKPILIIGLEEAKKHASSFSILNKQLSPNMFWTFGKREKRSDFEKDIELFQHFVLKNELDSIKYYYFNILTCSLVKVKNIINIINNDADNIIYINDNMIYLHKQNYVVGISLDFLDYINITKERILNLMKRNKQNVIYYNNFNLNYQLKNVIGDKKYLIPYLIRLNLIK